MRARAAIAAAAGAVILWALLPAARAVALVATSPLRGIGAAPSDLATTEVRFPAGDGVQLAGWLVAGSASAPGIVLVHGFKSERSEMLPWARLLSAAGYTVLMLDLRGCGRSEGWTTALGAREAEDVVGAERFLSQRLGGAPVGALGVSLGAGIVLRAAAADPAIAATVADSAWPDQDFQLDRLRSLRIAGVDLPLLPYGESVVDVLAGAHVRDARPIDEIGRVAPRAVFLIASVDDDNATTPPKGEAALFSAAREPKQEWRTTGGHIGAIRAHPEEYRDRVLRFFAEHLHPFATLERR